MSAYPDTYTSQTTKDMLNQFFDKLSAVKYRPLICFLGLKKAGKSSLINTTIQSIARTYPTLYPPIARVNREEPDMENKEYDIDIRFESLSRTIRLRDTQGAQTLGDLASRIKDNSPMIHDCDCIIIVASFKSLQWDGKPNSKVAASADQIAVEAKALHAALYARGKQYSRPLWVMTGSDLKESETPNLKTLQEALDFDDNNYFEVSNTEFVGKTRFLVEDQVEIRAQLMTQALDVANRATWGWVRKYGRTWWPWG